MNIRCMLPISVAAAALVAGCGGSPTASHTVTVTPPAAATPSAVVQAPAFETIATAPAPAPDITLPDITGVNADLAQEQLEKLGLKNVEFASANPKYSVVVLARNWTVTGMEPAAGNTVKAGDTVILKVYKD